MHSVFLRLLTSADSQRAVGLLEPALLSTARAAAAGASVSLSVEPQHQHHQQHQHRPELLLKQAQQEQRPACQQLELRTLQRQHWAGLHTAAAGGSSAAGSIRTSTSSSQAAEQSKAITRLLREASNTRQLQDIVAQHGSAFNAINVAAALSRASHILTTTSQQQQQHQDKQHEKAALQPSEAAAAAVSMGGTDQELQQQLLQELSSLWQQQLQQATPRELTSVLLASSKLSLFDPTLWTCSLAALLQQLAGVNSQDASSAAYALATAAVANDGSVPGVGRQQLTDALLTLSSKVHKFAAGSSGGGSSSSSSRGEGGPPVAAQAISNLLWSLARLEVQPPLQELAGLLQGLADPRVLASASPLAVVNSLWALSELQHLTSWGRNCDAAAVGGVRATLSSLQTASNGAGKASKQQQLLQVVPAVLLSEQQLAWLAKSSSQAVSNAVLALSRFATGPQPHLLEVPAAQSCIRQLLADATVAKSLAKWNAQDVGNAVYAAAQVGVVEPGFMQAVMAAVPVWLPEAGPATVAQVALGLARLKLRHNSDFLEALVLRGKQLLLRYDHHHQQQQSSTQPQQQTCSEQPSTSSTSSSGDEAPSRGGQRPDSSVVDVGVYQSQQEQHMCECLATDLSWSIAVLNLGHLAKDIAQLIRASGIKQESSLHPRNARRLWVVHAWLAKHKLAGGHGLQRLLTEQQLAFCAAASRHTHRLTPPPASAVVG